MIHSHSLIFSDFDTDWYKHWAKVLKQNKPNLEGYQLKANKFWQNAIMAQILHERGLLKAGNKAIGFGVGQERLPAAFAKAGVKVVATDQDFRTEKAKHWQKYELATSAQSLNKLSICNAKKFHENVSYESLDMTKIPSKFSGEYDIAWSNCALGHLGSIESGLQFIINSAKCLKPGGYAVHTTEINVISNGETVDNNKDTIIFRPKDIYSLSKRLQAEGYELDPLKLNFGTSDMDQRISISPVFGNDYSKLQVGGHIITQIVLIVRKPLKASGLRGRSLAQKHRFAYLKNMMQQKKFAKRNAFIKGIKAYEKVRLGENMVEPLKKELSITLKNKPRYVYIEYKNTSPHPIFGMHDRLYTTKPIALATSAPNDRKSKFIADDWHNAQANRPSTYLCIKQAGSDWSAIDYIRPGASFAYRLRLDPAKLKAGLYSEKFSIVQEGVAYLNNTEVTVNAKVN
ncbi:MAG: hypothetical protein JWO35_159 [Candidatus Saccharibacteria bacterium]|nr:hypothetical protein [Candidatus Saccharibacteria bacterium]